MHLYKLELSFCGGPHPITVYLFSKDDNMATEKTELFYPRLVWNIERLERITGLNEDVQFLHGSWEVGT